MAYVEVAGDPPKSGGLKSSAASIVLDEIGLVENGSRRVNLSIISIICSSEAEEAFLENVYS